MPRDIDDLNAYYFEFSIHNIKPDPSLIYWNNSKRLWINKDVEWCQLREDYCVLDTDMAF